MNIFKFGIYGHHPKWWFSNIKQFFRNIKYAWQRATRGFADPDWWEFDSYLSQTISGCLKEFDKKRSGFPSELYFKLGEEAGDKKWSEVLIKIAENMEQYEKIQTDCPPDSVSIENVGGWHAQNQKEAEKLWNDAFDLLKRWHGNMWD